MVIALYPPWYQTKLEAWKRGEIDWESNRRLSDDRAEDGSAGSDKLGKTEVSRLLVHLRLDTMPGVLALVSMFSQPFSKSPDLNVHPSKRVARTEDSEPVSHKRPLQVHGIRLQELTDRESSVMTVTELEEYSQHDHVLNTFRTFGQISNLAVRGRVLLCPTETYPSALAESASSVSSDLVLLSWSTSGSISENQILSAETAEQRFGNSAFSHFLFKTLAQRTASDVAIFVDNGLGSRHNPAAGSSSRKQSVRSLRDLEISTAQPILPPIDPGHHVFLPFFGTQDDEVALRLVLQLARNPTVTATVMLFELQDAVTVEQEKTKSNPISDFDSPRPETGSKSATATMTQLPALASVATFYALRDSLPPALAQRVVFETTSVFSSTPQSIASDKNSTSIIPSPASEIVAKARSELGQSSKNAGDLIVMGQNLGLSDVLGRDERWIDSEAGKVLGGLAGAMVYGQSGNEKAVKGRFGNFVVGASLMVVRAAE